ncbi:MAG TPA: serine/threonine protein kinase, partial [Gammaproteobacteria bacterium]|nr:serine/threonine protein kinase [Gammaproteobacteria bacterium]
MDIEHLSTKLEVHVGQYSDRGQKALNEDCLGYVIPDEPLLTTKGIAVAIADGVSSAEEGKEASEISVRSFLSDYYSTPDSWTVKTSAHKILAALNRWLYSQGQHHIQEDKGYITTFSSLVLKSRTVHLFHVGDTRICRLRDGDWEQLTNDHVAKIGRSKAYLARAMGIGLMLDVDYRALDVRSGDIFFCSTDGVHDWLNAKQIQQIVSKEEGDLTTKCEQIVRQAYDQGSYDNLSCQIIKVTSLPVESADDVVKRLADLPFPPFLKTGLLLDGFRILQEIHASSRSQLYVVEDVATSDKYVMKTPSANYEDDLAYIERFVMEEWIGSRIQSDYVVKVVAPIRPRKFMYSLTELVEGQTLEQWMATHNQTSNIQQIIHIVEQIAKGVRAFHRREVIHQDLKPGNIMINDHAQIKIIDFGSVHIAGIDEINTPIARDKILGTAEYSAPEVFLGAGATIESDFFSIGVIAFELLTGRKPYEGKLSQCHTL